MAQNMYDTNELKAMTPEEFADARAQGFVKPFANPTAYRDAETALMPGDIVYPQDVPSRPSPPQDRYAATAWASPYFDFITPGGQTIQMQKLLPEKMLGTGLLDKITRLPAFAQELIDKAEGLPPAAVVKLTDSEQVAQVVEVVNEIVPLVVVQPTVYPVPPTGEERVNGRIYVDSIELADRVAIMERAVKGVAALDPFRKKP